MQSDVPVVLIHYDQTLLYSYISSFLLDPDKGGDGVNEQFVSGFFFRIEGTYCANPDKDTVCLGSTNKLYFGQRLEYVCKPAQNDLTSCQRHRNDLSV